MGQLLYEVSRKYHFTFSFDSVLCNWVNYSHGITYVLTPGAFRHNFWSVSNNRLWCICAQNLKSVASSDTEILRGSRNFEIGHVPQATPTWGANLWSAGKNSPESTCTPNSKNVASSDTEILRGPKFRSPRSLAPEPIRHKISRLRGTVEEYYGSEFQVIPIKRFLSRALTYIQTHKHTNIHPKWKQYPRRCTTCSAWIIMHR